MKTLVIIPARYGSTRLPGKPLALIAGKSMLSRVVEIARSAIKDRKNVSLIVATDHDKIAAHCTELNIPYVMTSASCPTGTDRVLEAAKQSNENPDFIINLQGDAPLTPPHFITQMLDEVERNPDISVITPVTNLTWNELDQLRKNKITTPFSGTTVILDKNHDAVWFSKAIIPNIRDESNLRETMPLSPVYRHIGLYGYKKNCLEKYITYGPSSYEVLEGLEQLRFLENGHQIRCITVDYQGRPSISGVDSPEDITRTALLIKKHGENKL